MENKHVDNATFDLTHGAISAVDLVSISWFVGMCGTAALSQVARYEKPQIASQA